MESGLIFTADDGQIELWQYDYLVIGTIESYYALKEYFGDDVMVIIYRSRRWIKTVEGVRKRTGTDETAVCRTVQKISCRCRRFLGGESGKGGESSGDFKILIKETCMEEILREINVNL